ncbi:MAG: PssE/Cps14G family polysaccharide biosynthesis glycosyltransferase [Candidatus Thorarchaeota archaeon]|nr:PssE/Cps14G family polysaccharide biosynthesis glycosyltransferase [Candidatus Thorarchaeota archaeon]
MIFVTVGTAHYDPLIQKMDELVGSGTIEDKVIGQIGRGMYIPKNFRYFRFLNNLNTAYEKASVVVSTGGAGTTIECATRGLRLVVVENASLMEGHQAQLIQEMSNRGHLIWCKDLSTISSSIEEAGSKEFAKFVTDENLAANEILKLIRVK